MMAGSPSEHRERSPRPYESVAPVMLKATPRPLSQSPLGTRSSLLLFSEEQRKESKHQHSRVPACLCLAHWDGCPVTASFWVSF